MEGGGRGGRRKGKEGGKREGKRRKGGKRREGGREEEGRREGRVNDEECHIEQLPCSLFWSLRIPQPHPPRTKPC